MPVDFHFDKPEMIYLIFILFFILALFWSLFVTRQKTLHLFSSKENLKKLLIPRKNNLIKVLIFCLAWIAIIFALMQPKGNGHYPNSTKNEIENQPKAKLKAHDMIFMVDASASMAIKDTVSGKSRLDLATEIADEIMSGLQGESASLYAFTSNVTKLSPQTLDLFFVRMMLRGISINEGGLTGTDFLNSLSTVEDKHFKPSTNKLTTLIILSDGGDTLLETLNGEQRFLRINQILKTLGDPSKLNLRVFTIGIGNSTESLIPNVESAGKPVYSKLESGLLKALSEKGRGNYYEANQISPLAISKQIFEKLKQDDPYLQDAKVDPKENLIYSNYFQIPLAIGLVLLSFYLLFPNVSIKHILTLFCCLAFPLNASDEDLRLAQNYVQVDEYAKAINLYQNLLKENLGNYEKAVVLYDMGTTYLLQKDYTKAIDLFESIPLKGSPPPLLTRNIYTNLSLAKFNLSLRELTEDNDQIEKKVYLLKSSEAAFLMAKKAECELQKIKGKIKCIIPKDLVQLETLIGNALKSLSEKVDIDKLFSDSSATINGQSLRVLREKFSKLEADALQMEPKNLKELLQMAIDAEQETLNITRRLSRLNNPAQELINLAKFAQHTTNRIAEHYSDSIQQLQEQSYKMGECQKKPWNEIIPLYNKGYEAALGSLQLMSGNLDAASLKQEEAIKYWKQILSSDQQKKESDDKQKSQTQPESVKNESALQILQEMRMSDKQQNKVPTPIKSQESRPW